VLEGVNETGLSAGLFFFPNYGEYAAYKPSESAKTLCDMQFVSWVLSQFSSIDELKKALQSVNLVTLNHKIGSVHWRITQPDGQMAVLEVVGGVPHFYDNQLGVFTNSPGFPWHITNLNNYVNLRPGSAADYQLNKDIQLMPLGHGSGMLGLPGDFTAPSRFVRAAFYVSTSPVWKTSWDAVQQAFHILNNFDIPIGSQFEKGKAPEGMQSATQFTAATDQKEMRFYYRTAYNSNIRCIDIKAIDFSRVKYQSHPLDDVKQEPVQMIKIG
jgi:choloylglycine hydrolase